MLEFHWQDLIFLLAAGFIGSFVDAAVGGGGLITLPAFMATGIPTPFALGSNKLASSIGAVTSFFTFARSGKVDRQILKMMPLAFLGSAAGACIASLLPEHLLRFLTHDAGDILAYIADERAVAAGAADRLRGHLGAVSFQDDAFQRQGGNGLGGTLGPLEGAVPAKADVEPLLCQPERVIGAAGIAVDDALGPVLFSRA